MDPKTPLYLVTGFLGAGKTRLFQRVSKFPPFDHALIIVNEFGDASIDDRLMHNQNGKAKPLAGGCVCCTSRHELVTTIQMALDQGSPSSSPPSSIVIETTGLASPRPILKALKGNQTLGRQLDLRIVTVIDASSAMSLLQAEPTAQEQLALADALVLTKTDLMTDESQIAALAPYLQQLNPLAEIIHSADQSDEALAHWLSQQTHVEREIVLPQPSKMGGDHIGAIQSTIFETDCAVSPQLLETFLFEASRKLGPSLLRLKGFVTVEGTTPKRFLVQMVQGVVSPPEIADGGQSFDQSQPDMQIVAIAEGAVLTELQRIFDGVFGKGAIDTPDAQALNQNPLSIAGF